MAPSNFSPNTFVIWLLRSPLHSLLSRSTLLLIITGRKSARQYILPVNYVRDNNILWVTSQRQRTWWRNLQGGAALQVVLKGKTFPAYGEAILDEDAVCEGLQVYLRKAPQVARYFGIRLDADEKPNPDDIAHAARERLIIRITLA